MSNAEGSHYVSQEHADRTTHYEKGQPQCFLLVRLAELVGPNWEVNALEHLENTSHESNSNQGVKVVNLRKGYQCSSAHY